MMNKDWHSLYLREGAPIRDCFGNQLFFFFRTFLLVNWKYVATARNTANKILVAIKKRSEAVSKSFTARTSVIIPNTAVVKNSDNNIPPRFF